MSDERKRGALARRLIRTRERRGMTQEQAAEEIGVHAITLARWETDAQEPRGLAQRALEAWLGKVER